MVEKKTEITALHPGLPPLFPSQYSYSALSWNSFKNSAKTDRIRKNLHFLSDHAFKILEEYTGCRKNNEVV